ncbi:LytR C-terminal domain-containing protein [Cellulomonas massiliensis]|uniref:LytR C-terminal domain-containing protein n=1 Tax=Cellulomonas massiliensis TaxID=1465811 RepID=UPI0003003C15|nr:LytR C-terminal domain-containing protein [Cellulomonas massiliensis]
MAQRDYPYADDEFDAPADPDAPRGVHRAPRSAWSRWWPFLAVLILAPALAFAAVTYLSGTRGGDGASDQPGSNPSASAPTQGGSASPTEGAEGQEEPSPGDTEEQPTAEPELGTPVVVLNAAGVNGLAARMSEKLQGVGFTSVEAQTFTGTPPASSVVYYDSEDLEATARLVADTLGIDAVELSQADAGGGVTVVLTTDPDA